LERGQKALPAPDGRGIIGRTLWRGMVGDPRRVSPLSLSAHAPDNIIQ